MYNKIFYFKYFNYILGVNHGDCIFKFINIIYIF